MTTQDRKIMLEGLRTELQARIQRYESHQHRTSGALDKDSAEQATQAQNDEVVDWLEDEATRDIDTAVRRLVDDAFAQATQILTRRHDDLEAGAALLLERETLTTLDFPPLGRVTEVSSTPHSCQLNGNISEAAHGAEHYHG